MIELMTGVRLRDGARAVRQAVARENGRALWRIEGLGVEAQRRREQLLKMTYSEWWTGAGDTREGKSAGRSAYECSGRQPFIRPS